MKKTTKYLFGIFGIAGICCSLNAQVPVRPTHVIFVLEENYAYSEIIGSSYAPTLTALSKASTTVNFTQAYAITHPSEPNYLDLFSGSNQGVTGDESGPDASAPFNDCNLGAALINTKKYTFIGYSESQPSVGWISGDSPPYYTKHCPWINWVGGTTDTIPLKSDVPMAGYWPDSNHYSTLPTVSWVIPNIDDDMHDPSTASIAIPNGDTWLKKNMMPLVRWCEKPANNSLVIVIWDEDDGSSGNNIPLLFCSGLCLGGNCSTKVTHYSILRTVEDMYGLTPLCGSSSTASDVPTSIWNTTAINEVNAQQQVNELSAWPVPATAVLNMNIKVLAEGKATISMYDITGRLVKEIPSELKTGDNYTSVPTGDLVAGLYFVKVTGDNVNLCKKIVVGK